MPDIDHCAKASELNEVLETIVKGEQVTEARFGEDFTRFNSANVSELKRLIAYHDRQCAIANGVKPQRRFAKRMRFQFKF